MLSGGGMFGAYQVGAWSQWARRFQPDLVVGASIGSLNGWAIAGGASGEELYEIWREAGSRALQRWKMPKAAWDGLLDASDLDGFIRLLHSRYTPRCEFGVTVTELPRLKPSVVSEQVTWEHLAASCAVPFILPQRRIGGKIYTDGGLLGALPCWAAEQLGATHIVGINVMPRMPWPVHVAVSTLRRFAGESPPPQVPAVILRPSVPLGGARDAMRWDSGRFERWMEMGAREAENISPTDCFE